MKYEFIEQHRTTFPLATQCKALRVSRSGFYAWRLLQQEGIEAGKHRVARLRQREGIEAKRKQRFRVTTEHHHTPAAAADLLNRAFHAPAPNQAWVGDMTFIRTREGWLHLAILLDLFSRKVVGWSMGPQPDQKLALAALNMAIAHRRPPPGFVHHTDRGAVYSGRDYRERIASVQGLPSMSRKKSAYDNAVAESFFSNLKNEVVHHCDFKTRDHARAAVFDYRALLQPQATASVLGLSHSGSL